MSSQLPADTKLPHVIPLTSMPGFLAYVHESGKQINFETSLGSKLEFFPQEARALRDWLNEALPSAYPGEGIAWADFLHHRARVIDEKHRDGEDDETIAKTLSMDPLQVRLIRTRDRSIP